MDHLIAMRFAERFLAVIIGGLAIYFGYRLFLSLPQSTDAEGRFRLPWNTSIVLSRVGPGVFFALFGSLIVGCSFFRAIQYSEGPPARTVNQGSLSREFVGSKDDTTTLEQRAPHYRDTTSGRTTTAGVP